MRHEEEKETENTSQCCQNVWVKSSQILENPKKIYIKADLKTQNTYFQTQRDPVKTGLNWFLAKF